jgi:DNA-binding response OmpR family regulator
VRQQCSILIVDDEEPVLLAMVEYFTHQGFAVDGARDVRQAEMLFAANHYAAVITDLQLTAGNDRQGFDLITYVRQRWPSVCVILLTANGSPEVEVEARRHGVEAFLHKPISLSNVERMVRSLLASRHDSPQG